MLAPAALAETVYHRGNSGEPETLDPHKTSTVAEGDILRDVYEGLVAYSAKAEVIPGAAESWTVSPDGLTYTFKIRANAAWSNGDPVKASDFAFSFRRLMDPATGAKYATVLYCLKNAEKINKGQMKPEELGVKAVDDRTLEVTLESPTPYFIQLLTHTTGLPVHPGSVAKFGKDFVKAENFVSNGAYVPKEVVPASHIRLERNPKFHDAANVKIDAVVFYPTEDRSAALRRFQAGELHSNNDVPADQVDFIKKTFGKQFRTAPYLGTYYFAFNTTKGPLGDARVRQALSMVVDREFLADQIWGGTMLPGYSFVPPGVANYEGGPAYATWKDMAPLDREEAALKLMKEAGYGPAKPIKLEIRYNTSENHKKTSVALAEMWKPLGVEVTYVNTDLKTHYAHLRDGGDFDIARAGWIADYSDPQNFLFLVESDNAGFNYARYKNPEYDGLMKKAAAETDLVKRAAVLKQAETIFMRDLPFVPLLYYASKNLVSDKLAGWEDNTRDAHPTRFLSLK
ncbi:peptide ABC transporter substrate-binding protein [Prosthecomicrobium sp. N25]